MPAPDHRRWTQGLWIVALTCGIGVSLPVRAAIILTFGQTSNGPTMSATNNAADTSTTITGTNIAILISQFAGGGAPLPGFLNFDLISSAPATLLLGQILQPYTGTVSFSSLAGGAGVNYLSVVFTDFVFGTDAGSSLTLSASEPPGQVAFTSDVLSVDTLDTPRAISFAFADVTAPAAIIGTTLRGFTSSISGTVSAAVAPQQTIIEPSSSAVLGVGICAIGVLVRRRTKKDAPADLSA
jgi:hypothetical protein